jgi:DNA-binding transcriptional regulator YiaG
MAKKTRSRHSAFQAPLEPDDIRRIRETLGLTQVQAGELLGGGPRAFAKYETGVIKPAASVANLLRLLEESPHELKTLAGQKTFPIDVISHRPFDVSAYHVRALTPKKFTILIERLLSAEAFSAGLPLDGIHVAAQITVGDGGEDARLEWREGPERTTFVPGRLTQFQLKASSVTPAKAGRDVLTPQGQIQPMVKAVLENGGTYVMLVAHPGVKQSMTKHEATIRQNLRAKRLQFRDEQIAVRDGAQIALWVNAHPPVAAWLLEQTQPGLTGPFRDWSHWAGRHEHDSSPWVDDPRLEPFRAELRSLIRVPRGIARVVGPSGVGKSRLTLEALGPDAAEEASRLTLSSLVLYSVESEVGSTSVKAAVQNLADAGIRAIVVVDRCDLETHEDLAGMVRRVGSQLSLATIDHEYDADHTPPGTLIIKKAEKSVVEGIVHNVLPGIEKGEEERLAHFAAGFPQAARLIAESWEGSLVAASNDALIDHVLLGRRAADKSQLRKAGMLLSVFGLIGLKPPLDADIRHLAALPGAPTIEELRESFEDLLRRGVAQARGRLVSLQPPPITQPLAERQWRQWSRNTWDHVLTGLPDAELRIRAAKQLALLNREDFSRDVVRAVCRIPGPFASVESLSGKGSAEVLSFLAEVDTKAVADLFEHVLGTLDIDKLSKIKGDTRRNLVQALGKIAFRDDTFEQGALLMLALASAENEDWSNNATGEFKNLFSVLGGSTAAGPRARLQMLDDVISKGDERRLMLVVDALLQGASTQGGYRIVGAELHGSRPALKSWMPTYWNEARDYIRACLERLAKLAAGDGSIGARAKAGLGREFRGLVGYGLLDDAESAFAVAVQSGGYWPEALGSLGDILVYDSDALKEGEERRVRALIARVTPTDTASRVRFLVTEMPWDYPVDEKLELGERGRRQIAAIEALAAELLTAPEELLHVLPDLSRADQRMSTAFGRAIAQRASDPLIWMDPITSAYAGIPADDRNFGLLGGFLGGLSARHPGVVETFKQGAVNSATFAPTLPFVCTCVGLTTSDVSLILKALNAGSLPPPRLRTWTFGGELAALPAHVLAPLFDALFQAGGDAYSIALDLLGTYVHLDRDRLGCFRPQLRAAAANAGQRPKHARYQLDEHHFKEVMAWILNKGRADPDATAIALLLAKQIVPAGENHNDRLIKPLLPKLLRDFPEVVWPILGEAITRDRANAWLMELSLGDNFAFHLKNPAILELPEEVLFAWCHAHPESAPAFAAALLPVLSSRNSDDMARAIHPRMRRLLDEFGDRDDVLKALTRNMHTFGWSGSPADYYSLYDEPLQALETHPHGAARRWARNTRRQLSSQADHVRTEEDERDADWGN